MKSLFLNEYVRSGMFLEAFAKKNPFDVIITPKAFAYDHGLTCPIVVLEEEKNIF
jgi:hypothetical protein